MTYLGTISNSRNGDRIDGYLVDTDSVLQRATIAGITGETYIDLETWHEMVEIASFNEAAHRYAVQHSWRVENSLSNSLNHSTRVALA